MESSSINLKPLINKIKKYDKRLLLKKLFEAFLYNDNSYNDNRYKSGRFILDHMQHCLVLRYTLEYGEEGIKNISNTQFDELYDNIRNKEFELKDLKLW